MVCLLLALVPVGGAKEKYVTGWVEILPSGGCKVNQKAIRCDRVAQRLRLMHFSPGFSVLVNVDDAPYETVVALLDSLDKTGIEHVFVMPPFYGTNPSKSVKHWIRLVVDGDVNHPLAMVMITTERFKTWRENLIVLPTSGFSIVDRLATERIGQGACVTSAKDIPKEFLDAEHRLFLFEHSDDRTLSCLFPRARTSCEFLSKLTGLPNVGMVNEDSLAIVSVADEIGCATLGLEPQ
jgi:hypothetical protein